MALAYGVCLDLVISIKIWHPNEIGSKWDSSGLEICLFYLLVCILVLQKKFPFTSRKPSIRIAIQAVFFWNLFPQFCILYWWIRRYLFTSQGFWSLFTLHTYRSTRRFQFSRCNDAGRIWVILVPWLSNSVVYRTKRGRHNLNIENSYDAVIYVYGWR